MREKLRILLIAESFFILSVGLLLPIYAIFVQKIGGDILEASGSFALFSFSMGVVLFFISRWEDHVKHIEKMIILGYLIEFIGITGYLFVSKPSHLFLVQIVLGIGVAIENPAWDALYSRFLDKKRTASGWGLYETSDYVLTGVAAIGGD